MNYINFRNLEDRNIQFSPRFNLFFGKNGQGKTSILEAIYFSATGKSFRTSKNIELIKYNRDKMGSYISYRDLISEKTLSVKLDRKNKEYKYNGKKTSFDEFYGKVNVVTFIPEDIELIVGSPSFRRSFFDAEIAQSNYEYVKNISIILNLNYRKLFDNKKELSLKYESFIGEFKGLNLSKIEEKIREKIGTFKSQEIKYGYSLVGPQRDDFKFILNTKEAKSYSSQGEKKSIIFALKLSEIDMVIKEKRETPIFLIDDISSYFDSIRKDSIINYLKKRELQVFISSTTDLNIESKNFRIDKGEIQDGHYECE